MSEPQFIDANFPPAPVADDAVGVSKPKNKDIACRSFWVVALSYNAIDPVAQIHSTGNNS